MLRVLAFRLDAPSLRFQEDTDSRRGNPQASGWRSHSNDYAAMYRSNHTAPVRLGVSRANDHKAPIA